jgi:hypothetical protein
MRQPRRTIPVLVFLSVMFCLCAQTALAQLLVKSSDATAIISMKDNTTGTGTNDAVAITRTGNALRLYTSGSERVIVTPAGDVGIGTSSPGAKLHVNGTARVTGATRVDGRLTANGGITATLGDLPGYVVTVDDDGVFHKAVLNPPPPEPSSLRYKTAIRDLTGNANAVLDLRPVHFEWISNGQPEIGLIAEEVDKVLPDLVRYDKEGRPDAVKYNKVPLYLLQVVRTQQSQITALEEKHRSEITALEERLKTLEEIVARMSAKSGVPAVAVSPDMGE